MATLILNASLNAWNVHPKIRDEWRSLGVYTDKLAQAAFASLACDKPNLFAPFSEIKIISKQYSPVIDSDDDLNEEESAAANEIIVGMIPRLMGGVSGAKKRKMELVGKITQDFNMAAGVDCHGVWAPKNLFL